MEKELSIRMIERESGKILIEIDGEKDLTTLIKDFIENQSGKVKNIPEEQIGIKEDIPEINVEKEEDVSPYFSVPYDKRKDFKKACEKHGKKIIWRKEKGVWEVLSAAKEDIDALVKEGWTNAE